MGRVLGCGTLSPRGLCLGLPLLKLLQLLILCFHDHFLCCLGFEEDMQCTVLQCRLLLNWSLFRSSFIEILLRVVWVLMLHSVII